MMRANILLCFYFISIHFYVNAQESDFDQLVRNHGFNTTNCVEVNFTATSILTEFYQNNDIDNIYKFLEYWKFKCKYPFEKIFRLQTILDIKSGIFNSDSINERFLYKLH